MQRQATASKVFYENQVKNYLTQNYGNFPELAENTPEYIRSNRTESYSSQGTTFTTNKRYEI